MPRKTMIDYCIYRLKNGHYSSYFYNESAKGRIVFSIFDEPFFWADSFKKCLQDPNDRGVCGEYVCINNHGNDDLEIESNGWDDSEDSSSFTIKKESLLKSIDLWEDFRSKRVPEIVIICDEEGNLDIVDRHLHPELCLIDTKKQSIKDKEYEFVLFRQFFFGHYFYIKMLDNDYRLSMLSELFVNEQKFVSSVEQALYNQADLTLTHDEIAIIIKGPRVTIQPHNCPTSKNYAVTILKTELLNLITQWNKLSNARAKNIIMKRYENQNIGIEEYHETAGYAQATNDEGSKSSSSQNDIKTMTLDELKAIHSKDDPNESLIRACQEKFGPADKYRFSIIPDDTPPNDEEIQAMQSLHNTIQKMIGHKFESLKMTKCCTSYREDSPQSSAYYLKMLMRIFNEDSSWTSMIKTELMNPKSSGIYNNQTCVKIIEDTVTIKPRHNLNDTLEDFSIEIDKNVLLDLINKWEELTANECQRITFTRHEDGTITLSGE